MAAKAFLGIAVLSTLACAAPVVSSGNTTDVTPSSKFLAALSSSPDTSSPTVDSPSLDMTSAAMEAAITDLMLGKSAFGATPMGGSVKKIVDILEKTMMPKVVAAHKTDQAMLIKLANEVAKCSSTKNSGVNAARVPLNAYRANSRAHKSCRNTEAVAYSSMKACLVTQRSLFTQKGLKCNFFAAMGRKFGTQKNNGEIMKKAGGETTQGYITRISATICGKHVHGTKGTRSARGGWGGGLSGSMLDQYLRAKDQCERAKRAYNAQVKLCRAKTAAHNRKKGQCNQYQGLMDTNSCNSAVRMKDTCEAYAGCYDAKKAAYYVFFRKAAFEEVDRKAEWRGLKRMSCLMGAFGDGKVTNKEVDTCKKRTVSTKFLTLKRPTIAPKKKCAIPTLYPATGAYKRAEFSPLPTLAKGFEPPSCPGMDVVSTTPYKKSPRGTKCERVALNGVYSAGALVKCTNGIDVRRSNDRSSCPEGTKIFSPASRADWKTFMASAGPLKHPHWIIDVTRPQNGCGGCRNHAMNSGNRYQKSWRTSDGSPWWLRSKKYGEPNGNYHANCYLHIHSASNVNSITFDDHSCNWHSKSYYCQPAKLNLKPAAGSPASCKCSKVSLTGKYSAGMLVKCSECRDVYKSSQKNSCPNGMKIFSPQSRQDWSTFLSSAGPLRAPHWIIDITRPSNGCGGCTRYAMKSSSPQQATWKTSDASPWWLRNSVYSEPNGDYTANCYLDLWRTPTSADTIQFNDGRCSYHARSYFCQPKRKPAPKPKPVPPPPKRQEGFQERTYYINNMKKVPDLGARSPSTTRVVRRVYYSNTNRNWPRFRARDNFAVRWTGEIQIRRADRYHWKLGSDDGSMLWVNDRLTVNNDGLHGMRWKQAHGSRISGKVYLKLDFFERGGHAGMYFQYYGADSGNRWVYVGDRGSKVYPIAPKAVSGFKEEVYYNRRNLRHTPTLRGGASMTRVVKTVVYGATNGRWRGFAAADNFAVRWTGVIQVSKPGKYRFRLGSDDGSKLYVNKRYTVNNDGLHGFRHHYGYTQLRNRVSLDLSFFERGGGAGMTFAYMGPDTRHRDVWVGGCCSKVTTN